MMTEGSYTVGALVARLDAAFPFAWADPWDRVGLVLGDPAWIVTGVRVTLDATAEAVTRAAASGANVVVTHHPPFLEIPERPTYGGGPAGTLAASMEHRVAVISLHTNLDRAPAGAEALAIRLGLVPGEPLERGVEEIAVVGAYVPPEAERALREAMAAAGAGRIGEYIGCAHVGEGLGHFEPLAGAAPAINPASAGVRELRVEMVCPRAAATRVIEAARAVHPYEEPVVFSFDALRARGVARYGRVCEWAGSLADLGAHVARTFGGGVRIWGDPQREITRVATANGSGSSLVPAAVGRADVLVTGEVRYHDALDGVARGLTIIEAGHDVTEWPLVSVLHETVTAAVPPSLEVIAEEPGRAWFTMEDAHDGG